VAFKEALFSSTLPPYVLDAVSANLAILKSPTVLRLENGDMWAGKDASPMPAAARAPALMCGIMRRHFLIFIPNWSGLCENSN